MEKPKDTIEPDEQASREQEPELWDWARTAGVSREELRAALEQSRPPVN